MRKEIKKGINLFINRINFFCSAINGVGHHLSIIYYFEKIERRKNKCESV